MLKNESRPGGLHENTFLLAMGDHGQTLNGDHGGGSPEEVNFFSLLIYYIYSYILPYYLVACYIYLTRIISIRSKRQSLP